MRPLNFFQFICAAIGITNKGITTLLYLTMAPRLFTLKPIAISSVIEKNTQKYLKLFELSPLPLVLQNKNNTNKNNRTSISIAAAKERICRTSLGYGLMVDKLNAWGVFFKKLTAVGSRSFIGMVEPPAARFLNACCLFTTACGKSRLGLMYRAVKNNIPNSRYKELKIASPYFGHLLASNHAMIAGIIRMIIKLRRASIKRSPAISPKNLLIPNLFCFVLK